MTDRKAPSTWAECALPPLSSRHSSCCRRCRQRPLPNDDQPLNACQPACEHKAFGAKKLSHSLASLCVLRRVTEKDNFSTRGKNQRSRRQYADPGRAAVVSSKKHTCRCQKLSVRREAKTIDGLFVPLFTKAQQRNNQLSYGRSAFCQQRP